MEQKGQNGQEQILVGIDVGNGASPVFGLYTPSLGSASECVESCKIGERDACGAVISDGDDRFGRKAPLGRAEDPLCTGGSGELDRLESHVRGNRNGDRAGWTGCEDYLFPEG